MKWHRLGRALQGEDGRFEDGHFYALVAGRRGRWVWRLRFPLFEWTVEGKARTLREAVKAVEAVVAGDREKLESRYTAYREMSRQLIETGV